MIPIIARFREFPAAAFSIVTALALPAGASTVTIDMRNSASYSTWFGGWGSIGQTFIAPTDLMLDVSMWTSRWSGSASDAPFLATLSAWNGFTPVGEALFTSTVQLATETATDFHFDFGDGVPMTVGGSYVFYFSTQSGGLINSHTTDPGYQSTYEDGRSVGGYNPGSVPTNASSAVDNVFVANFQGAASVPEPSSLLLLGSGFLTLAWRARRRA